MKTKGVSTINLNNNSIKLYCISTNLPELSNTYLVKANSLKEAKEKLISDYDINLTLEYLDKESTEDVELRLYLIEIKEDVSVIEDLIKFDSALSILGGQPTE